MVAAYDTTPMYPTTLASWGSISSGNIMDGEEEVEWEMWMATEPTMNILAGIAWLACPTSFASSCSTTLVERGC